MGRKIALDKIKNYNKIITNGDENEYTKNQNNK